VPDLEVDCLLRAHVLRLDKDKGLELEECSGPEHSPGVQCWFLMAHANHAGCAHVLACHANHPLARAAARAILVPSQLLLRPAHSHFQWRPRHGPGSSRHEVLCLTLSSN